MNNTDLAQRCWLQYLFLKVLLPIGRSVAWENSNKQAMSMIWLLEGR
jgi:hypothetical protein